MNIRVGITGADGFLGTHIIRALQLRGSADIIPCDRSYGCNLLDSRAAEQFVGGKDVIIHAAAVNRGTDTDVVAGTVAATYNTIAALEKNFSRAKLIFLSSIQAETETVYGQSKKLAEIMLEDYAKRSGAPVSVFRLTNIFGEGCKPFYNSVVATFCHQVACGEKLTINPESRDKKMNLVYVEDAAAMIAEEVFARHEHPFYFKRVSSDEEITVGELAQLIESFASGKPKLKSKLHRDLHTAYLSYTHEQEA